LLFGLGRHTLHALRAAVQDTPHLRCHRRNAPSAQNTTITTSCGGGGSGACLVGSIRLGRVKMKGSDGVLVETTVGKGFQFNFHY